MFVLQNIYKTLPFQDVCFKRGFFTDSDQYDSGANSSSSSSSSSNTNMVDAALLSGALGIAGSAASNAANLKLNDENNKLNYQIWQEQKDYDYSKWKEQLEYNTPSNQMLRLRSAGLNPNLVASAIAGSNTATSAASSGQRPNLTAGQIDSDNVTNSLNSAYSLYQQGAIASSQVDLTSAQAEQVNIDNITRLSTNLEQLLNLQKTNKGIDISNSINEIQRRLADATFNDNVRAARLNNELIDANISKVDVERVSIQIQNDIAAENLAWLPKEKAAGLAQVLASTKLTMQQTRTSAAQERQALAVSALNYLQSEGVKIDNDLKEDVYDLSIGIQEQKYRKDTYEANQYMAGQNTNLGVLQPVQAANIVANAANNAYTPPLTVRKAGKHKSRKHK